MKKIRFISFSCLIMASLILLESCVATIISSPKQNLAINSTPNGAKVYVNTKEIGVTPLNVRLKRSKFSEINIEQNGYKAHNEIVFPSKVNFLVYVSCLCFYLPAFFDMITGAAYRLNKNAINTTLIKIPPKIENSEIVICDKVNVKYRAGDKMGNIFKKKEPIEIIYYGKTIDFNITELQRNVNLLLKGLGFPKIEEEKGGLTDNYIAKYSIVANVVDLKYNIYKINEYMYSKNNYGVKKSETKCEITTNWQIQNRNKDILFEKTTKGEAVKFEYGGTAALYDAFENSFYEFMYNNEVYEIFKKTNLPEISKNFNEIKINKPIYNVPNDKLINYAVKSVVTIKTQLGNGSGCVISSDGYVVTNFHIIEGEQKIKAIFKDGTSYDAKVIRFDEETDVALLKISGTNFNSLISSIDDEINIGSDVFVIGTHEDIELSQTVTKGIISGERKIGNNTYIQTDGSINNGCNGGALINSDGVLIGVINSKIIKKGVERLGFATPMYKVLKSLKVVYK